MQPKPKYEVVTDLIRLILNKFEFTDEESLSMAGYYPTWDQLIDSPARTGAKFTHNDELYEVAEKDHIFRLKWEPSAEMEEVYRHITMEPIKKSPEELSAMRAAHERWIAEVAEDPVPQRMEQRMDQAEAKIDSLQQAAINF